MVTEGLLPIPCGVGRLLSARQAKCTHLDGRGHEARIAASPNCVNPILLCFDLASTTGTRVDETKAISVGVTDSKVEDMVWTIDAFSHGKIPRQEVLVPTLECAEGVE